MEQSWPIPVHIIRKEHVDLESEVLSSLGASVMVGKHLQSKPLTFGVMAMLEVMDNAFLKLLFTKDETIEPKSEDLHAIFYLNHERKNALEDVRAWFRGDKQPLEKKINDFAKEYKIVDGYTKYIIDMVMRAHLGFRMIPNQGGESSAMIYGTESQAYISYVCSEKLNISNDDVIWNTPLTLIGHIIAIKAAENGVKNVERPHDVEQLNEFKEICRQCDEDKELYPWQREEPFKRGIFKWQHEDVLDKWIAAAKEYIKKNGQQYNADDKEIRRVKSVYRTIRSQYLKELKENLKGSRNG